MDLSRALAYITDDDDWLKKLLIGGLLTLIPIVGQFWLMGYLTELLKNVIEGRESPLPELLDDFGDKLVQGLLYTAIGIIYALPLIVIGSIGGIGIGVVTGIAAETDAVGFLAALSGTCLGLVMLVLGILTGLVSIYAWGRFAETGQFAKAFELSKLFEMIKANLGQTLLVLLVLALLGMVAASVGTAACGIGAAFAGFYAQLVGAFLYGKLYLQAKAKIE